MSTLPPPALTPPVRRPRIEDYALVGDMESAALVCRDGSVDWLCLPRFDSDAVFAGLLGTDAHGFWRIGPAVPPGVPAPRADRRRYRGQTLVVESEWNTSSGTVRVLDLMPQRHGHGPRLVRIVEGVTGAVEMTSTMRPRCGYGRNVPWIYDRDGRTVAVSGPDALWLDTTCGPGSEKEGSVVHRFTVPAGARVVFTLSWTPSQASGPEFLDAGPALAQTCAFWEMWAAERAYDGPHREAVIRSLLTLKALTYDPTGGIVAAPTTSLPEELGGERNYDYRLVWLRDSAVTLSALLRTGCRDEAVAWRQWLLRAIGGDPENLQIMYRPDGHRDMPERELPWLTGYEDSRPVRVGNGAVDQRQLDVPGEVIETLALAHKYGVARCENTEALIMKLVDYVRQHWRKPDDGIWEVRGGRRHFTHSKIMCWVAVDRAVRLTSEGMLQADLEDLVSLRAEIHAEVCAHAYDPQRNTFTQSYGSKELDASLLLLPLTGFLPADDPRVTGTVDAVRRELSPDGLLVHRYRTDGPAVGMDGFTGDEGAFLLCSFWLVDALALTSRLDEAEKLFEQLLALRSELGLLAEEYDPVAGRQLGNFPQAYSMLGLVNSAVLLHDLRKAQAAAVVGSQTPWPPRGATTNPAGQSDANGQSEVEPTVIVGSRFPDRIPRGDVVAVPDTTSAPESAGELPASVSSPCLVARKPTQRRDEDRTTQHGNHPSIAGQNDGLRLAGAESATPVSGPRSRLQIREVTSTDCPKGQDTRTFIEDGDQQASTGTSPEPSAQGHRHSSAGTDPTAAP